MGEMFEENENKMVQSWLLMRDRIEGATIRSRVKSAHVLNMTLPAAATVYAVAVES